MAERKKEDQGGSKTEGIGERIDEVEADKDCHDQEVKKQGIVIGGVVEVR